MMSFLKSIVLLGVAGCVLTSAASAQPAPTLSDQMIVFFHGARVYDERMFERTAAGEGPLVFTGPTAAGFSFGAPSAVALTESDNTISDLILLQQTVPGQQFSITFFSDDNEENLATTIPIGARRP